MDIIQVLKRSRGNQETKSGKLQKKIYSDDTEICNCDRDHIKYRYWCHITKNSSPYSVFKE